MSRSAIDRRHKASWPAEPPQSLLPSEKRSYDYGCFGNIIRMLRYLRCDNLSPGSPSTEPGVQVPGSQSPIALQHLRRKPVPRGPTERGHFSEVVEVLNADRVTPGNTPPHEPRSYFDWGSDDDRSSHTAKASKSAKSRTERYLRNVRAGTTRE
ncbi:hypothetical protein LTR37_006442 [Vermiconidia calcicola]|uniref:Uncharacterized protein n=1 Tax=Vermiconidia calcicola TaxID=1690605 RepID=A0ACC3NI73_9PEZI|nr:hypothetical protein LTR37_006442 [Vermiconidia calcicola]